jgi:hypothetical protein
MCFGETRKKNVENPVNSAVCARLARLPKANLFWFAHSGDEEREWIVNALLIKRHGEDVDLSEWQAERQAMLRSLSGAAFFKEWWGLSVEDVLFGMRN